MTERKLFGTDGVRGRSNSYPMTAEMAMKIGMAAGKVFIRGDHRHSVVIGKDTRISGNMLQSALEAGFVSMGMDVILVGDIPTPAVAMLTRSMRADLGVMISASHNPFEDNGIKLFGPDGYKLSDAMEQKIEDLVLRGADKHLAPPDKIGQSRVLPGATGRYIEFAKNTLPRTLRFDNLKVVLDCANGAAYRVAPIVLQEMGAEVIPIGVSPDGQNINKNCGSTATAAMRAAVKEHGAHVGIALDGDADRILVCDEAGNMVDGDQLMALIADAWHRVGLLKGQGVVATTMSNLGLERYLHSLGIDLVRTDVGDRYVVARMRADGYNLGGEQSGHIVLGELSTTGDGLVAGLQVLRALVQAALPASQVLRKFTPVPQVLQNVDLADKAHAVPLLESAPVVASIAQGQDQLNGCGRILIRKSGTQAMVRVMAEGDDAQLVKAIVSDICAVMRTQAGQF
jgi:phosphoglucosamine mutase